ncbi:hypothetical protein MVEN_00106600 [Mycena venus]|uniref:Uncharacterized protein n=1 Tax=Mycena venus TaxID=2733690 RepID=A0A8H6Z8W3_9AGAR|nr:hypothetical protein MVEN_00106600 [Mycena venus]
MSSKADTTTSGGGGSKTSLFDNPKDKPELVEECFGEGGGSSPHPGPRTPFPSSHPAPFVCITWPWRARPRGKDVGMWFVPSMAAGSGKGEAEAEGVDGYSVA